MAALARTIIMILGIIHGKIGQQAPTLIHTPPVRMWKMEVNIQQENIPLYRYLRLVNLEKKMYMDWMFFIYV